MIYTKALQPYVTKCYECTPSGLISVHEYVEIVSFPDECAAYRCQISTNVSSYAMLYYSTINHELI